MCPVYDAHVRATLGYPTVVTLHELQLTDLHTLNAPGGLCKSRRSVANKDHIPSRLGLPDDAL
jgi:hypothetical protein